MNNVLSSARNSKAKDKAKGIKRKVYTSKKRMQTVSTAITFVIILSFLILVSYYLVGHSTDPNSLPNDNSPKAALIDSLYTRHPNVEGFTKPLNKTLTEAGFKVDIYQGQEVTVDSLINLPDGYKLIILRMHSTLAPEDDKFYPHALYFFTAETHNWDDYTIEQQSGLVRGAYATNDSQRVFAVNRDFIKNYMTSKFNGTLVIAMGCDGACDPLTIAEFINQGAIGYVAWDGPVLMSHTDEATLHLLEALYKEKPTLSLGQAVDETNSEVGEDPDSGCILKWYAP